jgi:hypothetical protein
VKARRRAKAASLDKPLTRWVLAADGKTLRGSGRNRWTRTHLVAIVDHATHRVDARISVDGKTKETPALRSYVETIELEDAVLTADAAHTCRATAQAVIDSGGHYVLYVKGNQPILFGQIAEILLTGPDAEHAGELHAWSERGHGRITRRVLRTAPADAVDFPGAQQVMMTRRHRRPIGQGGRESRQIVYAVTSLEPAQAAGPATPPRSNSGTGRARRATTSLTSPSARTTARPAPATPPRTSPPCATWPSTRSAPRATSASPTPDATTPTTPSASSTSTSYDI